MKRRSLKVNATLNSIRSILNILFPIITFPYVSRVLGVNGIGIYNFSNSVVSYFLLIAALGINTYAIREGAGLRANRAKLGKFASEVFTINIWSTFVSYILLFICLIVFKQLYTYVTCILIFSIQILFTTLGTEWVYQIYEDYTYITIRSIIFQIISLILLFIFVRNKSDYLAYAAITVFSAVGANVLNFIHVKSFCSIKIVFHFNWKKHIKPILILFGTAIANMIYLNSDITILGLMKNAYLVGIYSVSAKVYTIVKTLISAILVVTVPRLAMLFSTKQTSQYKNILSNLANILVLLTLPASIGLFMLSKQVILIIAGPSYLRALSSLHILCFAYIFCILSWILNDCVLIPSKRENLVLRSMTTSAVFNIIFNFIFIPYLEENAAAISTVLAEFCMFVMNYYYSRDLIKDVFISRKLLRSFITSGVGCIGIIGTCIICELLFRSTILETIFSICLSVLVYVVILILLKNELIEPFINRIKFDIKEKFKL